jgi:hypothetical protein
MSPTKLTCLLLLLAAGCASSQSSNSDKSKGDKTLVPDGVTAAFTAEHPYAKMDDPREKDQDNVKTYIVPYKLPDGSTGQATYTEAGVLIDGR